jgi:hypothetical protein
MAGVLNAQAPGTGAIAGKILDPSGAVLPSAHITVVSETTNFSRMTYTSSDGTFLVPLLLPGTYSVIVEAPNFKREASHSIPVVVTETTVVEVRLEIGSITTEIAVTGSAELVQSQNASLGRAIDGGTILALPLSNRNFSQILALSPGVLVELPNAANLGRNTQNISANGAKTTSNNFQFSGIDANNLSQNSASGFGAEVGIAIPAPDTIAEFKVQTGMYDAAYGRGSGANVDIVSKSGSNHFHGDLWEFFRNDALNANDFFLKRNGQSRPVLKQNQIGFALGGPLRKDSTFFFGSYQGTIQRNGGSSVSLQSALLPPLTDDRSSQALGALFGGKTGALGGAAVALDGSNINPVALKLLNFKFPNGAYAIPSPQVLLSPGVGQSSFSIPARYREDQFTVNLDHKVSAQNQLSGRLFYSRAPFTEPFSPFGANLPGWGTNETDRNHMFVLSDTHALRPSLTNVVRFGFMRFHGFSSTAQPIKAADVGMATPSGLPQTPGIVINGLFTIGTAGEPYYFENTNSFIGQDTVSLTRSRHSIRMGVEGRRHQLALDVPFVKDGFLFFLGFPDFLLGESASQNGSSFSNIFNSIGSSGSFRKDHRYTDLAGFVQDDFRLNSRLTLNAGLRYEFFGPPSDIRGRLPTFDPAIAEHQVPQTGSFSGYVLPSNYHGPLPDGVLKSHTSGLWNPDYKDFSPRIGFALRLLDRPVLVLRGGYGIFYDQLSGDLVEQTVGQPPFSFKQSFAGAQNAAATLQQPYVPSLPPDSSFPNFLPRTPDGGLSLAAVGRHLTSPYVQQYNLNVQYQFAHDFVWEVGYLGSKTTHQAGCLQFNQAALATPQHPVNGQTESTVENLAQRVPFEGIAGGSYICQTSLDSNYNSLQTSVTKRSSHGLNFLGSYTFSKNLDFTSGLGSLSAFLLSFLSNDQNNPRQARGLNDFDRTHRFVLSFVYQVPKLAAGPALLRRLLAQWQFSGASVLQSGSPITVIDSTAGSIYGNIPGFSRAECTGADPASSGSLMRRIDGYFNSAAFTAAPVIGDGTGFGSCGVGILRGPSQLNLDLGIQKGISLGEGGTLQFRAESFNLTNTPKFSQPISDFAAGPLAFGVISSTSANPRIIQLVLKYSF